MSPDTSPAFYLPPDTASLPNPNPIVFTAESCDELLARVARKAREDTALYELSALNRCGAGPDEIEAAIRALDIRQDGDGMTLIVPRRTIHERLLIVGSSRIFALIDAELGTNLLLAMI